MNELSLNKSLSNHLNLRNHACNFMSPLTKISQFTSFSTANNTVMKKQKYEALALKD